MNKLKQRTSALLIVIGGKFFVELSSVPSTEQVLGGRKFEDDCELGTIVT